MGARWCHKYRVDMNCRHCEPWLRGCGPAYLQDRIPYFGSLVRTPITPNLLKLSIYVFNGCWRVWLYSGYPTEFLGRRLFYLCPWPRQVDLQNMRSVRS